MQCVVSRLDQTPRAPCISGDVPVEQAAQLHLRDKLGLLLHRPGRVVRDKPPVAAGTVCRPNLIIVVLRRAGPGQLAVVKHPVFPSDARVGLTDFLGPQERTAIHRHAQQDLLRGHPLRQQVRDRRLARYGSRIVVRA